MRLILGEGIELETLTYKLEEKKPKKQKLKREYRRAYLFGLAFTASIGSFVYGYAAVNVSIMSAIISEAYNYSQYIKDNECKNKVNLCILLLVVFSGILDTMYYLGGFISSIIAGHYVIYIYIYIYVYDNIGHIWEKKTYVYCRTYYVSWRCLCKLIWNIYIL